MASKYSLGTKFLGQNTVLEFAFIFEHKVCGKKLLIHTKGQTTGVHTSTCCAFLSLD